MPELPEVQTIVNDLSKKIVGRKIVNVWYDWPRVIRGPKAEEFKKQIRGSKIEAVSRRGKNILIYLTHNSLLLIHLKMTGHLLYGKWALKKLSNNKYKVISLFNGVMGERVNGYIHLLFYLDNGYELALSDLRKFAKALYGPRDKIESLPDLKNLGPDAINPNLTFKKFTQAIKAKRSGRIKQVLMDQTVIAGIGNIYSDDILWSARINPLRQVHNLKDIELKRIFNAMRQVLKKSLKLRGTSISDFRDTSGKAGSYGDTRLVYRREGEDCKRCGAKIKRLKLGGRSGCYCPKCQKG